MTARGPRWTGEVRYVHDKLTEPLRWRKPRMVFVNSMSDLFHPDVPFGFVDRVFATMAWTHQHTYQILTKRPERMVEYFSGDVHLRMTRLFQSFADYTQPVGPWPLPNVWLGVSVEDQETANERIPLLLETPAAVRFLSCEPLLGPIDLLSEALGDPLCRCGGCTDMANEHPDVSGLQRIDWVIVGGESGPGARPMHPDWVRSLRDQCVGAEVPFFFKQWGEWAPEAVANSDRAAEAALYLNLDGSARDARWGARNDDVTVQRVGKKAAGARLDGRKWREFPEGAGHRD